MFQKTLALRSILFILFYFICFSATAQLSASKDVLQKMFSSIDQVKTLTYTFKQKERMINGWNKAEVQTKLNVSPMKLYVKTVNPDPDIELLYVQGQRKNKALVNPNGFPWVNVKLAPTHARLLGTQHHPVTDSGFQKTKRILQHNVAILEKNGTFEGHVELAGSTTYDGKDCYILKMRTSEYKIKNYTVKANENLFDIAERFHIAEYRVLELNKGIKDYFDVKAGQKIKIPTAYAQKTTLYVDKASFLPIFQKMEDDKGVFEQYEFLNVKVNPSFKSNEFSDSFSGYGF